MPDKQNRTLQKLPVSNYGSAVARALEWLGDRYLLAKPINAHAQPPQPASASEQRQLKGL
jgi:hypothetical protein